MASSPSLGRGGREKCWEAKEKYFKCLDNGDECAQSQNEFFALCPSSWVNHFLTKRENEIQKKALGIKDIRQAVADGDIILRT